MSNDWAANLREAELARLKHELTAARAELEAIRVDAQHLAHDYSERLRRARQETEVVSERLALAVAGNAKLIHALDAAIQWGEALFAFLPEGAPMSESAKTAMLALREALKEVRR